VFGSWAKLPVAPAPLHWSAPRTGGSGFASAAGYTLTELLTVLAILTIVLGGLTALFVSATTAEVDMRKRFEAQQEARLAVDALRREVHCASTISQPSSPSALVTLTLPIGCPTGSGPVSWCTVNAGTNRYELYRSAGSTPCGPSGKRYADYLAPDMSLSDPTPVCGSPPSLCVFEYSAPTATTRAKLKVEFPVDVDSADPSRAYKLVDGLVLRNTSPTG
jgi:prepilin-type N-terminal cleavage/methylation domain-containing protein